MIAKKNYYADAEGNLVEESSEKAAFLVAAKGTEISAEILDQYGIPDAEAKSKQAPENKAKTPSQNKSAK